LTDTKLINLLKKFSPDEMRELEKYIASPYFSRSRDLNPFFKTLKQFYPDFSNEKLSVEYVFTSLYPGKSFEQVKSNNLIKTLSSEMFQMCKEFLIQYEFAKDKKRREYYLLNQLRKKKHSREFEKDLKKITDEDDFKNKGSVEYFIENYFFNTVCREYYLDNDDFKNTYESVLSSGEFIAVMALIKCLRNSDERTLADVYNLDTRYNLIDNLFNHLDITSLLNEMKKNNDRFYPYVYTYYLIHKLNTEKKKEIYYELKNYLNEHIDYFGKDELYILKSILLTFCSIVIAGTDRAQFQREQFEIYDGNLKLGIYKRSSEEDFHVVLFRNMALTSAVTGEFDWLEKFIVKYSPELPAEHRENMINFSNAMLFYFKNEFEKSLEYFSKIKLNLFFFKIDVRIFQLRIYYELNYFEQAYSLIDSTAHFLTDTQEASELMSVSTKNFLKYYRQIFKLKQTKKTDKAELNLILKNISEEKILASRDWLVSKINDLNTG